MRIVADEHDRDATLTAQLPQQLEHFAAALGIEAASRLIREQQARLGRQRSGDHHTLTLTHRQRLRAMLQAPAQTETLEQRRDLRCASRQRIAPSSFNTALSIAVTPGSRSKF